MKKGNKKTRNIIIFIMLIMAMMLPFFAFPVSADTYQNHIYVLPSGTSHYTIGDTFNVSFNISINMEINSIGLDNVTFNQSVINGTGTVVKGNALAGSTTTWITTSWDDNDDGYASPLASWATDTGTNNTNGYIANTTWNARGVGTSDILITEGGSSYGATEREGYFHNSTVYVHPNYPTGTGADGTAWNMINLTFNPGNGGNTTVIVAKLGGIPSGLTDGTEVYNNTGTTYSHTGLGEGELWGYKFWTYNPGEELFSLISVSRTESTTTNTSWPEFGTPSPTNGSTNHPLDLNWSIYIFDANGDLINWSLACSDGDVNSGTSGTNGTYWNNLLLSFDTTYIMTVSATEIGTENTTSEWYTFTTKSGPVCPDPDDGTGGTHWNKSEHARTPDGETDGTFDEDWVFLSDGWDVSGDLEGADWTGNWSLEYNTSGNDSSFSAGIINCSWSNRTQSLVWANVLSDSPEIESIYIGVVYAYYNDTNFSMVLYSSFECFLLDYREGILYNTEDGTIVTKPADALNYWLPGWGWDTELEFVDYFMPYDADGVWIKTLYNSYCGSIQSKYWGDPLVPMDEPSGWVADETLANCQTSDSVGFGVAVWNPERVNMSAYYDFTNMWRLNYTVNESVIIDSSIYSPHMDFPIVDMNNVGNTWLSMVFDITYGNITMDNSTDYMRNLTDEFELNSRLYTPTNSLSPLDQSDSVYYYSAILTNFSSWYNTTFDYPSEGIPNILLWIYIMDCPDGGSPFGDDYAFVGIDTDNDNIWDNNDRAFYFDIMGNRGSWYGGDLGPDFDAIADAFTTDSNSARNLHRYNSHNHYWIGVPLANILHNNGEPLNESDVFGLHMHTGNLDDTGVCVWENWNETSCHANIPEDLWGVTLPYFLNTPYPDYTSDLMILPSNLELWGQGHIGSYAGSFSDYGYGYEINIEKTCNVSVTNYTMKQVNYTIYINNTGDSSLTSIVVNDTFDDECLSYNSSNIADVDVTEGEGWLRFNISDLDADESFALYIKFDLNCTNGTAVINWANVTTAQDIGDSDSDSTFYGSTSYVRVSWQCGSSSLPTLVQMIPMVVAVMLIVLIFGAFAVHMVTFKTLLTLLISIIIVMITVQVAVELGEDTLVTGTDTQLVTNPGIDQVVTLSSSCNNPTVTGVQQYVGDWQDIGSGYYSISGKVVTIEKEGLYA